jgi:iron-sulfur cluster assembly protein
MATQSINKTMVIEDVFKTFPSKAQQLAQIMTNAGLHCVGCSASTHETLEQGLAAHGQPEDVTRLVKDLNKALTEKTIEAPKKDICFTKEAAEKCKSFRKEPNHMFKVGLEQGHCGWTYSFKFKTEKTGDEVVIEDNGVKILLNKNDIEKLKGTVIDYTDGLQGAGFKISNPNVKGTCGCGTASHF